MFCVYLNQIINTDFFLQLVQSFYDVIEDQKYCYSDPIYRKID